MSDLNVCPSCGATSECGSGCLDWGYAGRAWRNWKGESLAVFDVLLWNLGFPLTAEKIAAAAGVPLMRTIGVLYRMLDEGGVEVDVTVPARWRLL